MHHLLNFLLASRGVCQSWLGSHSFSTQLSHAKMSADWYIAGEVNSDPNGLTILDSKENASGYVASRSPLLTDSFRVTMSVNVGFDSENPSWKGNTVRGDPGLMIMFHAPQRDYKDDPLDYPPRAGDYYGIDEKTPGHGVYLALTTRENKVSPSISFGPKGHERAQTPFPRGIYWNYLNTQEFELMLDVEGGTDVHGYIRSKSSDRWTQCFSESLSGDDVFDPKSHLVISGLNTGLGVSYTLSRFTVTSSDEDQPGYQKDALQKLSSDNDANKIEDSMMQLYHHMVKEFSRYGNHLEELRSQMKIMSTHIDQIRGVLTKNGGSFTEKEEFVKIMDKMEKTMSAPDDVVRITENLFKSIKSANQDVIGHKERHVWFTVIVLIIVACGMGYVIVHMKRLEKKHIL